MLVADNTSVETGWVVWGYGAPTKTASDGPSSVPAVLATVSDICSCTAGNGVRCFVATVAAPE